MFKLFLGAFILESLSCIPIEGKAADNNQSFGHLMAACVVQGIIHTESHGSFLLDGESFQANQEDLGGSRQQNENKFLDRQILS